MQKMELDELNQLEEKVRNLVNTLKLLKNENKNLQLQLEQLKKQSSGKNEERLEIKKKVTTLIELIDSIEK
jgi:FtsZ-binding cell division protein ZapB